MAEVEDAATLAVVRACVAEAVGPRSAVRRVDALAGDAGNAVVRVTLWNDEQLVVKLTGPHGESPGVRPPDPERTARVMASARVAGVPTAEVLAARTPRRSGERGHLVLRHVDGVEWRRLRPMLDAAAVRAVHRQLADAVLALQSISEPGFGDLGDPPTDLPTALHERAGRLIADREQRERFSALLDRAADQFGGQRPTVSHDDLHSANVVLRRAGSGWRLAGVLDWDKAWAGPAESDVARLAFWDDMTGPGFWEVYRAAVPGTDGEQRRAAIHQLLWCLEYAVPTPRHRADTAALWAALDED